MASSSQYEMLLDLKKKGKIKSFYVLQVLNLLDRKHFVHCPHPYEDKPQSIGYNANLSAPHFHALALEYLNDHLDKGNKALDVGSGSGYFTACMATMVGKEGIVVGIDHVKEIVKQSHENINTVMPTALKLGQIFMVYGDGRNGYPTLGPYDAIHVGAAVSEVPRALLEQLKPGGRMFVPVGLDPKKQVYKIIDKRPNGSTISENLKPCCTIYDTLTDVHVQWPKSEQVPNQPQPINAIQIPRPKVNEDHHEPVHKEANGNVNKYEKPHPVERAHKKSTAININGYKYDKHNFLGEGGFGKVYKGLREKDGKAVAIKVLENIEDWQTPEWKIPEMVRNTHLVSLLDNFSIGKMTYIITELLDCDLRQLLKRVGGKFTLPNLKIMSMQLAKGYMALFSEDIIHRDIKPENVLVELTAKGANLKLADFGCGKLLDHVQYAQTYIGTKCYMAWEVFNTRHYDARADVWSLGLVLYECFFGRHFLQSPHLAHIQEIKHLSGDDTFDDLLLKMLTLDYHNRMMPMEFFGHAFHTKVPHGEMIVLPADFKL